MSLRTFTWAFRQRKLICFASGRYLSYGPATCEEICFCLHFMLRDLVSMHFYLWYFVRLNMISNRYHGRRLRCVPTTAMEQITFLEDNNDENGDSTAVSRKATLAIVYLIQASTVAHTKQHWNVYCKWNEFFLWNALQHSGMDEQKKIQQLVGTKGSWILWQTYYSLGRKDRRLRSLRYLL